MSAVENMEGLELRSIYRDEMSGALTKASVMYVLGGGINKKHSLRVGARWGGWQMKDRESLFNKAAILRERG